METLLDEILKDLTDELGLTKESDVAVLSSKIKSAICEVRMHRNYPDHFTEAQIETDLNRHYSNIRELALYDFNQVGAEGQTSHNENSTSRTWKDRKECLNGIFAFCR